MSNICHDMENWAVQSPEEPGFHAVVTPDKSSCKEAWIYRLNLNKGDSHTLKSGRLEMHPVLCEGAAVLSGNSALEGVRLEKYDSFYIPGETDVIITAQEDCFFYVAAAVCEGYGEIFVRKFDPSLPIGDIHQIHGEGTGRREVMFTLAPQDKASRLLCGSHGAVKGHGQAGLPISMKRIWKRYTATLICRNRTSDSIYPI